jgi:hypothetical protein
LNEGQKDILCSRGVVLAREFCTLNSMVPPSIEMHPRSGWSFGVCAYYRPVAIHICVPKCAEIGGAGMQWSYPGYTVDRTPYGVVQHELGHHADVQRSTRRGNYYGDFGIAMRANSGEKPITTYCPNDAEWFAEMFRVYVTNPDLLLQLRPRTHRELRKCFEPVFTDTWRERLKDAPARTIKAAERKVEEARA